MTGIFSGYLNSRGEAARLTTLARARRQGPGLPLLQRVVHNMKSEEILAAKAADAVNRQPEELQARLRTMQASGETPDKALIEEVKRYVLSGNRFPDGEVALLGGDDYFALTPFTPTAGTAWNQDQILTHDPEEVRSLIDAGNTALAGNLVNPLASTVITGLPAAGIASRAASYAKAHPDLVGKIAALGGLDGLEKDELPPRFLYPLKTDRGTQTLIGLMLQHSRQIGQDLNVLIPSILMLHPRFAELVLARLDKELGGRDENELDSIGLISQSMARRAYLTDQTFINGLDPTGHGDYPNLLAKLDIFNYLVEQGFRYLVFSNADEIMWSPNPFMIGIAERLISQGYAGIVFVVPNTNNQSGGGAVKRVNNPREQFLCEMPCLPADQLADGKYPLGINTTFYVLSLEHLANRTADLSTLSPALDIKTTKGRHGGEELALTLESWAGTEFTRNLRTAFALAPRAGFFTGVKSLEHSHSDIIPPELRGDPVYGRMTYEKYLQHLAHSYPRILKMMTASDPCLMEKLLLSGGSYLLDM